jgi:glycine betaine/proline transport system permease protein
VVSAVTQLDMASGFESGLAVVILAVFLDRVTAALGHPRTRARAKPRGILAHGNPS